MVAASSILFIRRPGSARFGEKKLGLGLISRKARKLFGSEKPFGKLQPAYSVKLVFSDVVKGIKIKVTPSFMPRDAFVLKIQRVMSHEMRPKIFGTFEKWAPDICGYCLFSSTLWDSRRRMHLLARLSLAEIGGYSQSKINTANLIQCILRLGCPRSSRAQGYSLLVGASAAITKMITQWVKRQVSLVDWNEISEEHFLTHRWGLERWSGDLRRATVLLVNHF